MKANVKMIIKVVTNVMMIFMLLMLLPSEAFAASITNIKIVDDTGDEGISIGDEIQISNGSLTENFYVAGIENDTLKLLTKYMVKLSTLNQSTDIVSGTDTIAFSSSDYWDSSNPTYPYNLNTNTTSITQDGTPALWYAKQYGAQYGVNGRLLTKDEIDTICGRTPDNINFYSISDGVTWPSWLDVFFSNGTGGRFWLGTANAAGRVFAVSTYDSYSTTSHLSNRVTVFRASPSLRS